MGHPRGWEAQLVKLDDARRAVDRIAGCLREGKDIRRYMARMRDVVDEVRREIRGKLDGELGRVRRGKEECRRRRRR